MSTWGSTLLGPLEEYVGSFHGFPPQATGRTTHPSAPFPRWWGHSDVFNYGDFLLTPVCLPAPPLPIPPGGKSPKAERRHASSNPELKHCHLEGTLPLHTANSLNLGLE